MNVDLLEALDACEEGVRWAHQNLDARSAWNDCKRGDWMLWLAAKLDIDRKLVLLAASDCDCDCDQTEDARRWCQSEATWEQARIAALAARTRGLARSADLVRARITADMIVQAMEARR